ncbi:MAG: hypothetical protein AAF288_14545 [Planctomycetota bacterium]
MLYPRPTTACLAATLALAGLAPALAPAVATADPGDIVYSDKFSFGPFPGDTAFAPRWTVAAEDTAGSTWQQGVGANGQNGFVAIDGGYIESNQPFDIDPSAYYRISVDARSDTPGQSVGLNFRWNEQTTADWQNYAAAVPGYASAFSDANAQARVRVVGRDTTGLQVDNVRVQEITAVEAAYWGQQVRESLPAEITTTQYVQADNTIAGTLDKLNAGETVRVVMLGDSVVNDTAHSTWAAQVSSYFPGQIQVIPSIRNGTGMQFYQGLVESEDEGLGAVGASRLDATVLDYDPDLVILGGVSHGFDAAAYASVIDQLQAGSDTDILITSEIGGYDYGQGEYLQDDWVYDLDASGDRFEDQLLALALDEGVGFADLRGTWGQFLLDTQAAGEDPSDVYRDPVHLNHLGQEVVGAALAQFFLGGGELPDLTDQLPEAPALVLGLLDLQNLSQNFNGQTPYGVDAGDFNGDGEVDLLDFDVYARSVETQADTTVPEPASLSLLTLAGLGATLRGSAHRRRRHA